MTTKHEFLNELKEFLIDKLEDFKTESDEESIKYQEELEDESSDLYEFSKLQYESIIGDYGDLKHFIENLQDHLENL